jgi:hypothetical protein
MDPAFKWLDPQMQELVMRQWQASQQQQEQNNDPMRQLQLQKGQLELQQMQNPPKKPPIEVGGRLLDPETFKPVYEPPKEPDKPMVLGDGSRVYDPNTGKIIVDQSPQSRPQPAEIAEYEYAKEQGFPGSFMDYQASKKGNGTSLRVNPETGAVEFQQGGSGNIKPLTESQSKDTVFATRAEGALGVFEPISDALTEIMGATVGQLPVVGNMIKSEKYQQAEQAGNEFLQAMLRKDTGAAITPGEQALYGKTYLPQPGDETDTLKQKSKSRRRALAGIKAGMTPQSILMQENALRRTGDIPVTKGSDGSPLTGPAGTFDFEKMSDDELKAFINGQ